MVPKGKWFRNVGSAFRFRHEDIYEQKALYIIPIIDRILIGNHFNALIRLVAAAASFQTTYIFQR